VVLSALHCTALHCTAAARLLACSASALRAQPYQMGAGTEGRRWLPERAHVDNPLARFSVQVQDGVTIAARDGTRLNAQLLLPAPTVGVPPTPCVLTSDGYGRSSNTEAPTPKQ